MLLVGSIVLNIACLISIRLLRKELKNQYETIMGMGSYIHAHTGRRMDEDDFEWYRDYWNRI